MSTRTIRDGLLKTRNRLLRVFSIPALFVGKELRKSIPQIEEMLLSSDVGIKATQMIIERMKEGIRSCRTQQELTKFLSDMLVDLLTIKNSSDSTTITPPYTVLTVGVNGTGKTTTIAKLAKNFKDKGEKVLLVASDTYRAAGVEQLAVWADKVGVDVLKSQMSQDPAAVAYDAIESSTARGYTVVLIDTAGRLHTKTNLMEELKKIKNVLHKKRVDLPQEILLVLDATTGQNALTQAKMFNEALGVTGIVLTKVDGTAKGGIAFAIVEELRIPLKYIGIGEDETALFPFDAKKFVSSILNEGNI
ncbi:MAG: signal recognition particle-docking protein FtsY [Candidatus Cloacimonas sp. 4484_209]|nr:MAG: signal recognition particle-docking protein FtsY [Candidatus Cloacimonas sp. 4484_209]